MYARNTCSSEVSVPVRWEVLTSSGSSQPSKSMQEETTCSIKYWPVPLLPHVASRVHRGIWMDMCVCICVVCVSLLIRGEVTWLPLFFSFYHIIVHIHAMALIYAPKCSSFNLLLMVCIIFPYKLLSTNCKL